MQSIKTLVMLVGLVTISTVSAWAGCGWFHNGGVLNASTVDVLVQGDFDDCTGTGFAVLPPASFAGFGGYGGMEDVDLARCSAIICVHAEGGANPVRIVGRGAWFDVPGSTMLVITGNETAQYFHGPGAFN